MGEASSDPKLLRYAAFSDHPSGGNPAGVVLDASGLDPRKQLVVAKRVGYSETAFLTPHPSTPAEYDIRFFSPEAEVPFCGHATVAAAVALAERDGADQSTFHLAAYSIPITTTVDATGQITASFTTVKPSVEDLDPGDLDEALEALRWRAEDLDDKYPPRIAYAGARHLILAAKSRWRLSVLDYDFERLRSFMNRRDLTTVDLVFAGTDNLFDARNPFPVGGVYEDPATGAAAAALGAYLRHLGLVALPARVSVVQGVEMGRPSLITVHVPVGEGPITVTGTAVQLTDDTTAPIASGDINKGKAS